MGIYEKRLAELRASQSGHPAAAARSATEREHSSIQSLLFRRDEGWTARHAKQWAQKHGYRSGDVDVTDQYVHIRQFAPGNSTVKRTITLGRGIRAVVAREESMATTKKASKRRSRRSGSAKKTAAPSKLAKRRAAAKKGWAHRRAKAAARSVAAKRTSRRRPRVASQVKSSSRRRRSAKRSGHVMESARRAPRRSSRRRSRRVKSWRGDSARHATAARKGWRRRKAKKYGTREATGSAVGEGRRRRRSSRRSPRLFDLPAGGSSSGRGMYGAEFAATILFGGLGFAVADVVDRALATYNPAGKAPTDKHKFTSDGAGTLANTLNVAASPSLARIAAGIGMAAIPGIGSFYVKHPFLRHSLEGASVGAGISLFKTFWNNVVMGAWLGPKDTTTAALQHSHIARLYPAEVVAAANLRAGQDHAAGVTFGALSGAPEQTGVGGHGDVGPFAGSLAGSSPYMDVAQALRCQAGLCDEPHPGAAPGGPPPGGPGPDAPPPPPPEGHDAAPPEGHHHGGNHHGGAGFYAGLWPGQPRFASVTEVWSQEGHQPHHGGHGGHGGHGAVHGTNSPAAPGWAGLGDWRTQDWHRNEWNRRRQWELQQNVAPPAFSNVNADWHRLERERRRQWELTHGQVLGIGDAPVADALTTATNAIVAAIPSVPPPVAQTAVLHTARHPHDVIGALQRALPNVPLEILQGVASHVGHRLHILHGLYLPIHRKHGAPPVTGAATTDPSAAPSPGGAPPSGPGLDPSAAAPPGPPPPDASSALPPPVAAPTGVSGHHNRLPGPPQGRPPGPPANRPVGPQSKNTGGEDCGCVGSDNPFLGFIGESQKESLFTLR